MATAQTCSRPTSQAWPACSAAVASQAAASVADEVLQAGMETSSDARSVSEAQYSDDFESLDRKTPSRTGEVLLRSSSKPAETDGTTRSSRWL